MNQTKDLGADLAREWAAAQRVIVDFLAELMPREPPQHHRHNARALAARLAANDPPILLVFHEGEKP